MKFYLIALIFLYSLPIFATADGACAYLVGLADQKIKDSKNIPNEFSIKINKMINHPNYFDCNNKLVNKTIKIKLNSADIVKLRSYLGKNLSKNFPLINSIYEKRVPPTKDNPGGYGFDDIWNFPSDDDLKEHLNFAK